MSLSVVLSAVMAFGVSITSAGSLYIGHADPSSWRLADWHTAQDRCSCLGGQLATFSNNNDYNAIKSVHSQLGSDVWIGMHDDNGWKMVDGATDYCSDCQGIDKWNPGEPNNLGMETCVEMKGDLNNIRCYEGRDYVCEFDDDEIKVVREADRMFVGRKKSVTWSDAQDDCECFGGNLATWSNSHDYQAIEMVQMYLGGNAWVGMNDLNSEGKWEMVDGATDYCSPYSWNTDCDDIGEWNPGEPNNWGNNEDCAEMNGNGNLNDNRCSEKRYYICEFDGNYKVASSDLEIPQMPWIPAEPVDVPQDFVIGTYSVQDLMVVALAVFLVFNVVTLAVFCLRAKGTATVRYAKVVVDSDEDARLNA